MVYATSAGQKASDENGRNGLFTEQFLKSLNAPGLEVAEVFKRTGADVAEVSGRQQVPAIYNQFFGTAYLGAKPSEVTTLPLPAQQQVGPQAGPPVISGNAKDDNNARLWTIGLSAGSSFAEPWAIGTLHGTIAPIDNVFLHVGIDMGFISGESDVDYYSLYPFAHLAYFLPMNESIGVYAGAGAGYFRGEYKFSDAGTLTENIVAFDAIVGVNILSMIDLSYTLRTDFNNSNHKVSAGYTYRF